ncbi:MAG: transcriptional repressor [Robiginitomaculum sp.]|nr:MAG: transcriptional repressor [Robiginitomaculum sp.]
MPDCKHDHESCTPQQMIEAARQICAEKERRFTPLREHVFHLIAHHNGPVKAYDLLDQLKPELGSPKPPTVYRALEFLAGLGLIHRVEALNAYVACDHSQGRHVAEFFICEKCEGLQERHANDHVECVPDGFSINRSVIEHYGVCKKCAA